MSQDSIDDVGDPNSAYDRFVLSVFGVVFQLAEVLLIVGAFKYASVKSGSTLLNVFAIVLGVVGSAWLGLVLPGAVGRLGFWTSLGRELRFALAFILVAASMCLGLFYLQAIEALAQTQ